MKNVMTIVSLLFVTSTVFAQNAKVIRCMNIINELAAVSQELGNEQERFAQYATQNPLLEAEKLDSLEEYSKKLEPTVLKLKEEAYKCVTKK